MSRRVVGIVSLLILFFTLLVSVAVVTFWSGRSYRENIFRNEGGLENSLFDKPKECSCDGYCVCSEVEGRRNAVSLANNGFKVVVSALSLFYATSIAKTMFSQKCIAELADSCPTDRIHAKVLDCDCQHEHQNEVVEPKEADKEVIDWLCDGECVPNSKHPNPFEQDDCSWNSISRVIEGTYFRPLQSYEAAQKEFLRLHLQPRCEQIGMYDDSGISQCSGGTIENNGSIDCTAMETKMMRLEVK